MDDSEIRPQAVYVERGVPAAAELRGWEVSRQDRAIRMLVMTAGLVGFVFYYVYH